MSFLMYTYSYFHKPRTRRQFHLTYPSVPYSFRGSSRTFERQFKVQWSTSAKGPKLSGRGIKISTWLASLNGYGGLYGNNHGNGEAVTTGTGMPVAKHCELQVVVSTVCTHMGTPPPTLIHIGASRLRGTYMHMCISTYMCINLCIYRQANAHMGI